MNKIIDTVIVLIIFLGLVAGAPVTSFAADMWNETPGLMHETGIEFSATKPAALEYHRPVIDIWAETPDSLSIIEDSGVTVEDELSVVYDLNPEMYAETPDLRVAFQ